MNAVPQNLISLEEFFDWLADQDGRFELVNGQIRMMAGAAFRHNVVKNNITVALTPSARRCGCSSTTSDTGIQTGPYSIRYPDIVIACGPQVPTAMIVSNPAILIEVSSPSTRDTDLLAKVSEYQGLGSVQIIMQVEPDVAQVAVYRRIEDGWQFEAYEGLEAEIDLPPLQTRLSLRDIYEDVEVKQRPLLQLVPGDRNETAGG